MPALAGVVTNPSCLVKQRRAITDLNLVSGISAEPKGRYRTVDRGRSGLAISLLAPEATRLMRYSGRPTGCSDEPNDLFFAIDRK
jgi:hypothetical protein